MLAITALIACGLVAAPAAAAPAADAETDAVALLPLDAERSLELYGQPVASELARALIAGHVHVVVVGPRMAVPETARLIIDGTIAQGKASAVTISIRIRSPVDGVTLDTLKATAPALAKIDSAAAELSGRVLPLVRDRLVALRPVARPPGSEPTRPVSSAGAAAPPPIALVAIIDATGSKGTPLVPALDAALGPWVRAHHREPRTLEVGKLDPRIVGKVVSAATAELAIGFWVLDYARDDDGLPMAHARVRVQLADASGVVFDRVIVTDTVLGEKASTPGELAARVARELLVILRPHVPRHVPSWP